MIPAIPVEFQNCPATPSFSSQKTARKLIISSVLLALEKIGFEVGPMHRLSIFNANAKFYVLMGTVAEIKKDDRCVEIENFLE